jgi:NAD dependent epimerase/dehydratase family enzyme
MKTALIIGGTGLIGKSLINLLESSVYDKVIALAKRNATQQPKLK